MLRRLKTMQRSKIHEAYYNNEPSTNVLRRSINQFQLRENGQEGRLVRLYLFPAEAGWLSDVLDFDSMSFRFAEEG